MADEQIPFTAIEKKWQKRWEEADLFRTPEKPRKERKFYCLDMFPYPSADGLHVGHPEGYTATDILCRYKRMRGFDVLHPMGFDAFGLPAENYAIKTGVHPRITTKRNVENMKRQIQSLGFSYDWDREFSTTDEEYYRWTQWIFLQIFKKGLAYKAVAPTNFCPSCKTGLANEEVFGGSCERCGTMVESRELQQWHLKITAYADRLLKDLEGLDWPESTMLQQRNWIGRSEGTEADFKIGSHTVKVFTTRPDTLYGATYMVLAPEHPLVREITEPQFLPRVEGYIRDTKRKSARERREGDKDKTGVPTGALAINPANGLKIPVWIADYVIEAYGTGAIMAVPAHDQRDFEFAKRYELPIRKVVEPPAAELKKNPNLFETEAFVGDGKAVNSGVIDGLKTPEAKRKITEHLKGKGLGRPKINYRLRDWIFSRQRYWGEPIPIVHCAKCGAVPVPESQLPVLLPDIRHYKPTGTGESPLAAVHSWVNTHCPKCEGPAKRETITMPQWAGSCWYYLRFLDPKNSVEAWDAEPEKDWMPVDCYVGGAEHAVLHLLYARFWHKVLYDLGCVTTEEPFKKLRHQGMILSYSYRDSRGVYHHYDEVESGEDGEAALKDGGEKLVRQVEKMSKSKSNVVNPDDVLDQYGADVFRLYEMFMGPFADSKPWNMKDIMGRVRFLRRTWHLFTAAGVDGNKKARDWAGGDGLINLRHRTIAKVGSDIEDFRFNTAISALDIYLGEIIRQKAPARVDAETFLTLLNPFAPHITEELWTLMGNKPFLSSREWPEHDPERLKASEVEIVVQINGKVRGRITVPTDSAEQAMREKALDIPRVKDEAAKGEVAKVVVVPNRLVNVVIKARK